MIIIQCPCCGYYTISVDETHIGMFDVDTCKKVVEICKPYSNEWF